MRTGGGAPSISHEEDCPLLEPGGLALFIEARHFDLTVFAYPMVSREGIDDDVAWKKAEGILADRPECAGVGDAHGHRYGIVIVERARPGRRCRLLVGTYSGAVFTPASDWD